MRVVQALEKTEDVNAAFLANQEQKILTQSNNICAKVVKGKYLHNDPNSFLTSHKSLLASNAWKSILDNRYQVKKGLI